MPVNITRATTGHAHEDDGRAHPTQGMAQGVGHDRPQPSAGRPELSVDARHDGEPPARPQRPAMTSTPKVAPIDRPGRLVTGALVAVGPFLAIAAPATDDEAHPHGHRQQGNQETAPTDDVSGGQADVVAGGTERAEVDGQGAEEPSRDEHDRPDIDGMAAHDLSHGRAQAGRVGPARAHDHFADPSRPVGGTRSRYGDELATARCGRGWPDAAGASIVRSRTGPPIAWWRSSQG